MGRLFGSIVRGALNIRIGGVHRRRTKLLRLLDARLARPIATIGRHHHSAQLRDGWGSCFGLTDTALV